MDRTCAVGVGITVLAVVGYALGSVVTYPGREAVLVGVMAGVTLVAVGCGSRPREPMSENTGTTLASEARRDTVGNGGPDE